MTRAYIRLDPAFDERKENYPDGPYATLIATFCLAEHQPQRGKFRSVDYLRRLLGHRGRHLRFLVEHGDVVELEDGRAYVDGWDEWQEGDWKVAERVERIRRRPRGTPPVTPPPTVRVTPDVTLHPPKAPETDRLDSGAMSGGGAMSASGDSPPPEDDDAPEMPAVQWLAQNGCLVIPGSGYHRHLITATERHGVQPLLRMMERLLAAGTKRGDIQGLLFGAIDAVDKQSRPNLSVVEKEDREEERIEAFANRAIATKVRAHELGQHIEANPGCPKCAAA